MIAEALMLQARSADPADNNGRSPRIGPVNRFRREPFGKIAANDRTGCGTRRKSDAVRDEFLSKTGGKTGGMRARICDAGKMPSGAPASL